MSISGNWNITIKSPMGPMPITLVLQQDGGLVTGTLSGQGQTNAISDGLVDGDTLSWSTSVASPMKMKLEFSGALMGDKISGKVKVGFMGSFPFEGGRATLAITN
jgi:hypothetical protein